MKTPLFFLAFLFLSLFHLSCDPPAPEKEDNLQRFCIPDSLMKNITLDTVRNEQVMSDLKLSGKITYDEDKVVKVYSSVSGRLIKVNVSLGDYMEKGQVLAVIRSSDIALYTSEFNTALSDLAIAKKNMDVAEELQVSGVSSEKDYITAQNEYRKAIVQYNKSLEVMNMYGGANVSKDSIGSSYQIKSPISGFIVEKNVNEGQELRADDANNLFTISDLKELWAIANVYESDIAKIKTGNDVRVSTLSYPDKIFTGKVERISNILNPETNVMAAKIRLINTDYVLKPGMFAIISVLFPEKEKMTTLPKSAVLFDDNKSYVVKFRKRCDLNIQEVNIFKALGNTYYLQDDSLKLNDWVIDRNLLFVFTALKKL